MNPGDPALCLESCRPGNRSSWKKTMLRFSSRRDFSLKNPLILMKTHWTRSQKSILIHAVTISAFIWQYFTFSCYQLTLWGNKNKINSETKAKHCSLNGFPTAAVSQVVFMPQQRISRVHALTALFVSSLSDKVFLWGRSRSLESRAVRLLNSTNETKKRENFFLVWISACWGMLRKGIWFIVWVVRSLISGIHKVNSLSSHYTAHICDAESQNP